MPIRERLSFNGPGSRRLALVAIPLAAAIITLAIIAGRFPSWPSGSSLAFVRSSGRDAEIFLVNQSGSASIFASGPGTWSSPAWSPDGQELAYVWRSATGGGYHLYAADVESRVARQLTSGPWIDASPSWAPDGSAIAFSSNRGESGGFSIFTISISRDGSESEPRWIAPGQDPSWSPDGLQIAHIRWVGDGFGLFLMAPNGGEAQRVAANVMVRGGPDWSPDGRHLAFSCGDENGNICLFDLRDGDVNLLTSGPAHDDDPAWSPDGHSVAFSRTADKGQELWLVSVRTGAARQITDHPLFEFAPAWQPSPPG